MKLKIKKAVAAMLSLTIICSNVTPRIDSRILLKPALIADAARLSVEFEGETTITILKNLTLYNKSSEQ